VSDLDIYRAREAQRLLSEPLLLEAMEAVRQEAFSAFLTLNPDEEHDIARLQAMANGAYEIRSWLEALIVKATATGFDPNEPTREDPGS
jgi:hypothetical protein